MSGLNKQMHTSVYFSSSVYYSQFNTFINSKQKFNIEKKYPASLFFSHVTYLSLGTEVARETKKQATVTVIK